jgi:hypothetical protein
MHISNQDLQLIERLTRPDDKLSTKTQAMIISGGWSVVIVLVLISWIGG